MATKRAIFKFLNLTLNMALFLNWLKFIWMWRYFLIFLNLTLNLTLFLN